MSDPAALLPLIVYVNGTPSFAFGVGLTVNVVIPRLERRSTTVLTGPAVFVPLPPSRFPIATCAASIETDALIEALGDVVGTVPDTGDSCTV
jgi:hypothetical protein